MMEVPKGTSRPHLNTPYNTLRFPEMAAFRLHELYIDLTSLYIFVYGGVIGLIESEIRPAANPTLWRWVQAAVKRAEELGALAPGKQVGTHTLRHSYARHLLMNGIPINYLSRWLGHSSIQTTLIYLELVPDPSGNLVAVP